jgi:hypothetical protein
MIMSLGRPTFTACRYSLIGASLVALAACASNPSPSAVGDRSAAVVPVRSNIITEAEIRSAGAASAYDLVQSLRPNWLNKRGPQTMTDASLANPAREGDIMVYMAVARLGGLAALREVAASSLVSVEFLDAAKANYRFGRGHPYGAIILSTAAK